MDVNLSIYRIKGWWYYLGYPLLGFAFAGSFDGWFMVLSVVSLSLAYAYSINEKYDKKKEGYGFLIPLVLSTLFLPFLNIFQLICFSLAVVISTIYSHRLFYLKSVPFLVTLLNGVFFSLFFSIGYLQVSAPDTIMYFIFLLIFLFNITAQIIHELTHMEEDTKDKIHTTATYFGERKTVFFLVTTVIISIFYSAFIFLINLISIYEFLLIISFLVFSLTIVKHGKWAVSRKLYKYAGIVVGVIIFTLKITF